MSVINDEIGVLNMSGNVISQLLTVFVIVSIGPAVIAYLAFKKAL
jgi:hypothetical protein